MTALRKTPIHQIVRPVSSTPEQPDPPEALSTLSPLFDDAEEREETRIDKQLELLFDALEQAFGFELCEAARGMLWATIDSYVAMAPERVRKRTALMMAAAKQCLKTADALEAAWGGAKFVDANPDDYIPRLIAALRSEAAVYLKLRSKEPRKAGNPYKLRDELLLKGLAHFFHDYFGGNIGYSIKGPWVTFVRIVNAALFGILPLDARPKTEEALVRRAKEMQPYFGETYPKFPDDERKARALYNQLWLGSGQALLHIEEMIKRLASELGEQPSWVKAAAETLAEQQTKIAGTQQ